MHAIIQNPWAWKNNKIIIIRVLKTYNLGFRV